MYFLDSIFTILIKRTNYENMSDCKILIICFNQKHYNKSHIKSNYLYNFVFRSSFEFVNKICYLLEYQNLLGFAFYNFCRLCLFKHINILCQIFGFLFMWEYSYGIVCQSDYFFRNYGHYS